MKRLRIIAGSLVVTLALIQVASPTRALGHAFPLRSDPRVGWKVSVSPAKVTIWFDSELEPAFSTLAVYDSAKQRVDKNNARVSPSDATVLEVDLPPLLPGSYRVYWSVVAKDTHRTEGSFPFSVQEKSP
jgi:methionine-rich copper-binding protein CopC